MTELLLSFAGAATGVVFWEIIKQIGVRLTQAYAPSAVARALIEVDRLLPQLLAEGVTGADLERRLRAAMSELTGSEWQAAKNRFDLSVFLQHQNND